MTEKEEKAEQKEKDEFEDVASRFILKSNCYTGKTKYPRTTNNQIFVDWSRSPIHDGKRNYYTKVVEAMEPGPPWVRFRPLPPIECPEEEYKLRTQLILGREGLRTPEDSFHFGYKHFSRDKLKKKFRHYNDPIPHPLDTEARFAFQDPKGEARAHLNVPGVNHHRYGLTPSNFLFGIGTSTGDELSLVAPASEDIGFTVSSSATAISESYAGGYHGLWWEGG